MKNIKKFKKSANDKGYNFYYGRSLKLYALYKKESNGDTSAQYLTKELIDSVISVDVLIGIYII
jgi:acyl-CoA-binding protein